MKNITLFLIAIILTASATAQKVGIDASTLQHSKFTVEQTAGSENVVEQILWNRAPDFTRLKFRNNTLGYWQLAARIGNLVNPS
jgi:hypothetical protein